MVARFRDGMDGENDPLLRAHFELQNDGDCIRFGYKDLVDEMERVVFAQSEQVKRITPLIAEHFSSLGLSVLAMHKINNYHPWAADFVLSELTVMEEFYPQTFWDWQELWGKSTVFCFPYGRHPIAGRLLLPVRPAPEQEQCHSYVESRAESRCILEGGG